VAVIAPALLATEGGAVTPAASPISASLLTVRLNGAVVPDVAANLPLTQDIAFGTIYGVCCVGGNATTKIFTGGWSIATLIEAAGAVPSAIQSVTIERAGSAPGIKLLPPDFDPATPGGLDFPNTACALATPPIGGEWSCPAFIYPTGAGTNQSLNFFRPERASAPADENIDDWVLRPIGSGLTVDISGTKVAVSASANHTAVRVGQLVRFTAAAVSPVAGDTLTFTWSLSDGTTLAGPRATHAFAHPGAYQVIATATGSSGSGGASAPITIVVGKKAGSPGPGGATSTTRPATTGGDRGTSGPPITTPPSQPSTPTTSSIPVVRAQAVPAQTVVTAVAPHARPRAVLRRVSDASAPRVPGEILVRGDLLADAAVPSGQNAIVPPRAKRATGAGGTHVSGPAGRWLGGVLGIVAAIALYLFGLTSERRRRKPRPRRRVGRPLPSGGTYL
jgi:hypothetical protein